MNIHIKLITFSLVFLLSTLSHALAQSVPQLAKKALAATVSLTVQDRNGNTLRRGCGFFIQEDLVATTFHVIEGDVRVSAVLANSETTYRTDVMVTDEANNLALLKVRGHSITPLHPADSDTVHIGETVYVPQVSLGTVSVSTIRDRRNIDTKKERLRMTDSIWTGNSGAPLLNLEGKVIGMFVSNYGAKDNQTSNLAIPSNALKALLTRPPRGKEPIQRRDEKPDLPDSHPTVSQLVKKALAATVSLKIQDRNGNTLRRGCGFFIQEGLIATTFHAIEGDVRVNAVLANSETTYRTNVMATDEANNLALLKVRGRGITPLPLADSDTVPIGDTVYVPQAFLGKVKANTILGWRNIDTKKDRLQMTDSIWAENSGAPVLNHKGRVIGVFVSDKDARDEQKSNLVIPSNALKALLTRPPRGEESVPGVDEEPDLPDSRPTTVPDLANIAFAATVSLEVRDGNGVVLGSGSGFFVRRNLIATNHHVIEGAAKVSATIVNTKTRYPIEGVAATDEANNLAFLKVTGRGITRLHLADSDTVRIGETVYVPQVSLGIVSVSTIRNRRNTNTKKERLRMTTSIWSGNSGAPLLNDKGKVIGMFVSDKGARDEQRSNLAIPSNALKSLLTRPPNGEKPPPGGDENPDLPDIRPTVPDLAKKALAATVSLEVRDENGTLLGRGSGFFVQRDLIATNHHVIEGAAKVSATLVNTKTRHLVEGFTAVDEEYDIVLLKVAGYGVTPLPLGDSDKVQIGETVYVAGNPKGLIGTFSDGIISAWRDRYTKKERLQMTAPISPGSSGGPVLDIKGNVIGVSVSIHDGVLLSFAIPSNALNRLLDQSGAAKPFPLEIPSFSYLGCIKRGNEQRQSGDYAGAILEFTHAIRLNPNDGIAYVLRGICRAELGQHVAGIADYDIAIRLNPADSAACLAYLMRGVLRVS